MPVRELGALLAAVACGMTVAWLLLPGASGLAAILALALFGAGLLISLMALRLSMRQGRPAWVRAMAGATAMAFVGAAAWLAYLVASVPFS